MKIVSDTDDKEWQEKLTRSERAILMDGKTTTDQHVVDSIAKKICQKRPATWTLCDLLNVRLSSNGEHTVALPQWAVTAIYHKLLNLMIHELQTVESKGSKGKKYDRKRMGVIHLRRYLEVRALQKEGQTLESAFAYVAEASGDKLYENEEVQPETIRRSYRKVRKAVEEEKIAFYLPVTEEVRETLIDHLNSKG